MAGNEPALVGYLTLVASLIAASGTILNWFHERSKRNEHFDVTMEWVYGHSRYGEPDFYPTLIVHNRSSDSIAISDVRLSWGWARRREFKYTALDYEDPEELNFPYIIDAATFWKRRISNANFVKALERVKWARLAWLMGRPSLWIRVETIRGTVKYTNAMQMIEFLNMPEWLKGKGES